MMNDQVFLVIVDTRTMYSSDIEGYEEHTCSRNYFDEHVTSEPQAKCVKSKVAEMCGLDVKIYFHHFNRPHPRTLRDPPEIAITSEQEDLSPKNIINGAATLLTFDPRTGFPEYNILGKAYVIMDSGDYPLSSHQVWGMQYLISEARDLYYCDPDHLHRGRRQLRSWCLEYQEQEWGPATIYEPRIDSGIQPPAEKHVTFKDLEESEAARQDMKQVHDYYSHRHLPNCKCRLCSQTRYHHAYRSAGSTYPAPSPHPPEGLFKRLRNRKRTQSRRTGLFSPGSLLSNTE